MCPPKADEHVEDIGLNYSDEDLIMSLSKMIDGASIPGNVIRDVNPFHYLPSDLPDGICFFICSEVRKDTEFGFWKNKGEATQVLSNLALNGWKTTLEFYEGRDPHFHRTDWIMLMYTVSLEGQSETRTKGAYSLCRIFSAGTKVRDGEGGDGRLSIPDTVRIDGREEPANTEIDYFSRGDYLELLDLDNAVSRSSSENSSCLTMSSSDEYFDYLAWLQDLEREDGKKDAVCKYNISTTNVAREYILPPACEGSAVMSTHQKSLQTEEVPHTSVAEIIVATEKVQLAKGGPGPSRNSSALVSSENHSSEWLVEKKAASYRMKMVKKYLCFI